jgi:hypothetical protein
MFSCEETNHDRSRLIAAVHQLRRHPRTVHQRGT